MFSLFRKKDLRAGRAEVLGALSNCNAASYIEAVHQFPADGRDVDVGIDVVVGDGKDIETRVVIGIHHRQIGRDVARMEQAVAAGTDAEAVVLLFLIILIVLMCVIRRHHLQAFLSEQRVCPQRGQPAVDIARVGTEYLLVTILPARRTNRRSETSRSPVGQRYAVPPAAVCPFGLVVAVTAFVAAGTVAAAVPLRLFPPQPVSRTADEDITAASSTVEIVYAVFLFISNAS